MKKFLFIFSFFLIALSKLTFASDLIQPEASVETVAKTTKSAKNFMISVANPVAANVGFDILHQGGTALDAALAVQLVLGLVEPQSSGIGGGGFLLYYDANNKKLYSYDGRETAPKNIPKNIFLSTKGEEIPFCDVVISGKSVGVPGLLKMYKLAHQKHGKLSWNSLFQPAINVAKKGFVVSKRLAKLIGKSCSAKVIDNDAKLYFYNNGEPLSQGVLRKNIPYARTLENIVENGLKEFYDGKTAADIVNKVNKYEGFLELQDFQDYEAKIREPICSDYRGYKICGMGPPSSGAITIAQILGILENFDLKEIGKNSVEAWHLIIESAKLAYADRGVYIADSDFVNVPVKQMLKKKYLRQRAQLINLHKAAATPVVHGILETYDSEQLVDKSIETPSITHISIVDKYGNAASVTASVEHGFGSSLMVNGFLLNNELTDFSFNNKKDNKLILNRIEPNKRPRSSMSPTIVFDKSGKVFMLTGAAGGSRIIQYVAKTLIGVVDWGLDIQSAIDLPNITNNNGSTFIEKNTDAIKFKSKLEALGHKVIISDLNSGIHAINMKNNILYGGADSRREGLVLGE